MRLSREEEMILDAIDSLNRKGLPIVPMSVAVRSGLPIDRVSVLLEQLKKKNILGDAIR